MTETIIEPVKSQKQPDRSQGSRPKVDAAEAQLILAEAAARTRSERAKVLSPEDARLVNKPIAERFASLAQSCVSAQAGDVATRQHEINERRRIERLVAESGVPKRYAAARIISDGAPTIELPEGYRGAMGAIAYLIDNPAMVALLGNRGTGKTWMACGLVNTFTHAGRFALYRDAMDFFLDLKASYDDGAKLNQQQVEAKYIKPELLVLDELHERGDTEWEDRMLTRLINKRYVAMLTTVLISNQDEAVFGDRVGKSVVDRIRDGGGLIVCDWQSLRGKRVGRG